MFDTPAVHYTVLGITLGVYVLHIILSSVAARGGNAAFPYSQLDMAKAFELTITPAGATFSIWAVIFAYQVIWLVYAVVDTVRRGVSAHIQSKDTLMNFLCYTISTIIWLFVWSRKNVVGGLASLVVAQFFINIALGYSCSDLYSFIETYGITVDSRADVGCQRYLVQNGIIFNATWITIATLLNAAIVLRYELNVSDTTACLVALTILGLAIIVWFLLENWALEEYTEYTFTNYIVVIVALIGILFNGKTSKVEQLNALTIGLLVIACLLFLLRIVFLVKKCCCSNPYIEPKNIFPMKMRKSYTN